MFGNASANRGLTGSQRQRAANFRARPLTLENLEGRKLLAELAQLRLQATDLSGQQVSTLMQGQEYYLNALVKDLRATPVGVFSAYFDLSANDNSLLTVVDQAGGIGGVLFSPFYLEGRESINNIETASKELDDVGAFTQEKYYGDEKLLFSMRFRADTQGTLQFATNPADNFGHTFSLRQLGTLADSEVSFGTLSLNIVNTIALTNDFATVSEDAAATTVNVLGNDPGGSSAWTIQSVSEISAGGTIQITNGGKSISYRPAADFFGTETFKYQAIDGSGIPGEATVTVTVNSVNDAPRNQFPPANKRVTDEDTPITFARSTGNHIGIWDDQVAPATDRVNLFALDGGTIFLPNLSTLISQGKISLEGGANNTPSMQIRGLTADVNTALDGLQFTPKSNFFTVSPSQVARIRIWTREVGSPAPLLQADNTFEVTVNSVNDAPINTVPGAQVANSSRVVTFSTSNRILTSDVDIGTNPMRVTLQVASGVLTLGSTTGINFQAGANNSASMTIQGTLTDINNALLNLKYTGNAGATDDLLTVTTSDLGSSGSGGTKTDQDTIAITIPAQNQPPVNTVPGPQSWTSANRSVTFDSTNRISVNDADAGSANLRVTLFVNGGTITLPTTSGLTFLNGSANGTRYLLFDGSLTSINNALLDLKYVPDATRTSDTLTIDVNDLGNSGPGGSKTDRDTVALTGPTATGNQPPVNTVPGAQTYNSTDRKVTFDSTKRISVNDPDAGTANLRVTLFVNGGTITLPTVAGLTFLNGSTNGSRYLLFDGSQANINAALLNLQYVANAGRTSDTLTLDVNDLGNTGSGGSKTDRDTIALSLSGQAVNQAPVNTVPGSQTWPSSTRLITFDSTKRISTNDPDAGSNKLRVTLFVNNGVIKLSTVSGLTFLNGSADNTRYLLFDGNQSAINAALLNLKYTANSGATVDTLTMDVNDLGNTGSGGSKVDRDTIGLSLQGFGTSGRSGGGGSGEAGSRNSPTSTAASSSNTSSASDTVFAQSAISPVSPITSSASASRLIDLLASNNSGRNSTVRSTDAIFGEIA